MYWPCIYDSVLYTQTSFQGATVFEVSVKWIFWDSQIFVLQ